MATALGQTGLGAEPAPPSDLQTIKTLAAVLFAYGSSMAASDWSRASMCLAFFQSFWTNTGYQAKRYALAQGAPAASVSAIPDDLAADGMFGVNTAKVAAAVLLMNFGVPAQSAADVTPTNAGGVALWFQRQVAPLAAPSSSVWSIWNSIRAVSTAALTGDAVSRVALAYWNGTTAAGVDITTPSVDTTGPRPVTTPGTGTAPVPGGLPTVTQASPITVIGTKAVVPNWVYWSAGAIAIGAVIGVGYYMVQHRPELFKSRAKRRRR